MEEMAAEDRGASWMEAMEVEDHRGARWRRSRVRVFGSGRRRREASRVGNESATLMLIRPLRLADGHQLLL
jgi:hypothetical protein